MMLTGIESLDRSVHESQLWLQQTGEALGAGARNPRLALASLKVTLHALRDQLPRDEAVRLAEPLPTLLKGLYYEGWRPGAALPPAATRAELLARIDDSAFRYLGVKAERALKAALETLAHRIPAAQLAAAVQALPEDLRSLWPDEPVPYTDLRAVDPMPPPEDELRQPRSSARRVRTTRARRTPQKSRKARKLRSAAAARTPKAKSASAPRGTAAGGKTAAAGRPGMDGKPEPRRTEAPPAKKRRLRPIGDVRKTVTHTFKGATALAVRRLAKAVRKRR